MCGGVCVSLWPRSSTLMMWPFFFNTSWIAHIWSDNLGLVYNLAGHDEGSLCNDMSLQDRWLDGANLVSYFEWPRLHPSCPPVSPCYALPYTATSTVHWWSFTADCRLLELFVFSVVMAQSNTQSFVQPQPPQSKAMFMVSWSQTGMVYCPPCDSTLPSVLFCCDCKANIEILFYQFNIDFTINIDGEFFYVYCL